MKDDPLRLIRPMSYWIDLLKLESHPEGGFFRESYRASESILSAALPSRFNGPRSFSTAIYFLLPSTIFSALHRIRSDEVWHFYEGAPLTVTVIHENGTLETIRLGSNPHAGELFQAVVPAGAWFGARVMSPDSYALVGCTVAPGFDFSDFEMADRDALCAHYPEYRELVVTLTR